MRKLWVLLKLNFRAMLRAFSFRSGAGSSKKKAAGGLGALLLMAFLALYLSGGYSFLLASMVAEVGIVEMVRPLRALMACVMSLMFTLFAASGLVFGGKDSDIVLALPVPGFTVMLSKILALYRENLVFCGLWMLPTGAAYLVYAGLGAGQVAGFCVRLLAAALFLPLLPSVLALLGVLVIAYFSGRMKHKSLVGTVLSIVLTGAVLVGSLQINALAAALLQNIEGVRRTLHTWLLPLGLLLDGLVGSWGALLGFLLISLAPFLVLVWGMSTQYKRILSSLASHVTRSDYRLREVKAGGRFAALFKKECGRYFGTTIYLLNTGIGAVMLLGFSVYVLFVRGQAALLVAQMGGAQAVAALAYGTETVPKVDKIVGPGNIYVATAKRLLFGKVDIDMVAGPSEILILADRTAEPAYLAADLMSQAEHDRLASAILLTDDAAVAERTLAELERQMTTQPRAEIIRSALADYGAVIVCRDMDEAVAFANRLAPEHLEVMCEEPMSYIGRLDNAGSVFLGKYSPEPLGDYYAGPNHVLPTSGTARFFSPLSVDSFIKKSSFICYNRPALEAAVEDITAIARAEGLEAHARSIEVRFPEKGR